MDRCELTEEDRARLCVALRKKAAQRFPDEIALVRSYWRERRADSRAGLKLGWADRRRNPAFHLWLKAHGFEKYTPALYKKFLRAAKKEAAGE